MFIFHDECFLVRKIKMIVKVKDARNFIMICVYQMTVISYER